MNEYTCTWSHLCKNKTNKTSKFSPTIFLWVKSWITTGFVSSYLRGMPWYRGASWGNFVVLQEIDISIFRCCFLLVFKKRNYCTDFLLLNPVFSPNRNGKQANLYWNTPLHYFCTHIRNQIHCMSSKASAVDPMLSCAFNSTSLLILLLGTCSSVQRRDYSKVVRWNMSRCLLIRKSTC